MPNVEFPSAALMLTYDLETYTTDDADKTLVPFLLCFSICDYPNSTSEFSSLHGEYSLSCESSGDQLMDMFKTVQESLCVSLLSHLETSHITMYIVGHNTSGFDAIFSGHRLLLNPQIDPEIYSISHSFLPRNGKILISETVILNRATKKKLTVTSRDTYNFTMSSLKNATAAYGLTQNKGFIPFAAINDHFNLGCCKTDPTGTMLHESYYTSDTMQYRTGVDPDMLMTAAEDYCTLDVRVTQELALKIVQEYSEFTASQFNLRNINIFCRPTLSSFSHAIFKKLYATDSDSKVFLKNIYVPTLTTYNFVRASIRGGRVYPLFVGEYNAPLYVWDICGMYASALTHPLPMGRPILGKDAEELLRTIQSHLLSPDVSPFLCPPAIFLAHCIPPPLEQLTLLPPLNQKDNGKLFWTNETLYGTVLTSVDACNMAQQGWRVYVMYSPHNTVFPDFEPVARKYITQNILAKEKYTLEKNETKRTISKLLSNALYGSFATNADCDSVIVDFDPFDPKFNKKLAKGDITIVDERHFEGHNLTLIKNNLPPENNKYPTHLASFVLAWTRCFTADWQHIATGGRAHSPSHADPEGTYPFLYGDTDSLFLTEIGHQNMLAYGQHRNKSTDPPLIYQDDLKLAWAAECETICPNCKNCAYGQPSVFLAPKMYSLKVIHCPKCNETSKGKQRAKGHPELTYKTLLTAVTDTAVTQKSSRQVLKRTLNTSYGQQPPFTIRNNTLTRLIRHWQLPTLRPLSPQIPFYLYPLDDSSTRASNSFKVEADFLYLS